MEVRRVVQAPTQAVIGYGRGLGYVFRGLRFVFFDHPSLARIWIFPVLITTGLMVLAAKGAWDAHDDLVLAVVPKPEGTGFWVSLLAWMHGALDLVVGVLLVGIALVLVILLSNVLAAPFNDALSERVERLRTGCEGAPFRWGALVRDIVRTIGLELLKLLFWGAVMVPLWLLSLFLPGIGQILYSFFGFGFTSLYWAVDYVDWPAARRNVPLAQRMWFARQHLSALVGFGTGVWLFLFVPLFNLVLMPAAVAGGTLLYIDLTESSDRSESMPPSAVEPPSS